MERENYEKLTNHLDSANTIKRQFSKIIFQNGYFLTINKNNLLVNKSELKIFYFRFIKDFHKKPHSRNQKSKVIDFFNTLTCEMVIRQKPCINKKYGNLKHNINNGDCWNNSLDFSKYENIMGEIDVFKSGLISHLKTICGSYKVVKI